MTLFIATGNSGKLKEYSAYIGNTYTKQIIGLTHLEHKFSVTFQEPLEDYNFFLENALLKLFSAIQFMGDCAKNNEHIKDYFPCTVVVDDSGLCVPQLNYEPGVHSAYHGGMPRSAEKNRQRLQQQINEHPQHIKHLNEYRLESFFVCFLCTLHIKSINHLNEILAYTQPRSFNQDMLQKHEMDLFKIIDSNSQQEKHYGNSHTHNIPLSALVNNGQNKTNVCINFGYCLGQVSTVEQTLIPNAGHGYDNMFYARQHPNLSFSSIDLEQKNSESHRAYAMQAFIQNLHACEV